MSAPSDTASSSLSDFTTVMPSSHSRRPALAPTLDDTVHPSPQRLVIVIGMHRSGTSAITRAVMALGLDAGAHLMPASAANEKGFFEDLEVNALNVAALHALGRDWHSLSDIGRPLPPVDALQPWIDRAADLLSQRLARHPAFVVKDPRLCRLLPIWQAACDKIDTTPQYVIAVRNPLSVARSLAVHHSIGTTHAGYLWLEHNVDAMIHTQGSARVVVDYDVMLEAPHDALQRLASQLGTAPPDTQAVGSFADAFLENRLRHAAHTSEDLALSAEMGADIREADALLQACARDSGPTQDELDRKFRSMQARLRCLVPLFSAWGRLSMEHAAVAQANADFRVQADATQVHVRNIETARDQLNAENASLGVQLATTATHVRNVEARRDELLVKQGEFTAELESTRVHARNVEANCAKLAATNADLGNELDACRVHVRNIEAKCANLSATNADLAAQAEANRAEVGRLEAIRTRLESAHATAIGQIDLLQVHVRNLETSRDQLLLRQGSLQGELDASRTHSRNLEAGLARLRADHSEALRSLEASKLHLEHVQADHDDLARSHADVTATLESTRSDAKSLKRQLTNAEAQAAAQHAEIATLRTALTDRDTSLLHAETRLRAHQAAYGHAKNQLVQINTRRQAFQDGLLDRLLQPLQQAARAMRASRHRGRLIAAPREPHHKRPAAGRWPVDGRSVDVLLVAELPWHKLAGWHRLAVHVESGTATHMQIELDVGHGFDPRLTVDAPIHGAHASVPLPITGSIAAVGLRLYSDDPHLVWSARLRPTDAADGYATSLPAHRRVWQRLSIADAAGIVLEPTHEIDPCPDLRHVWSSIGQDPQFLLRGCTLEPGWHRIGLALASDQPDQLAQLFFDTGSGFSETGSVTLPVTTDLTIQRVFHLDAPTLGVRFDPCSQPGAFSVDHLRFERIDSGTAYAEMARQIALSEGTAAEDLPNSTASLLAPLQAAPNDSTLLEALVSRYARCFRADSSAASVPYRQWLRLHDDPAFADPVAVATEAATFVLRPRFSVIMPVFNTSERLLRLAIESVRAQSYPEWELCIADDASPRAEVRELLARYAEDDPRIRIVLREKNGHISAASNSALALASGDFVALLDHDDELSPHALHHVVAAINKHPTAAILYSDEDKLDEAGERFDPHFKSDWNPDLLLSQNYVSHLGVYRADLVRQVGGFRVGFEGSQDYDLLLRCVERIAPTNIVHIPKILYHWRAIDGSTARAATGKSYPAEAGLKALREHLAKVHEHATVQHGELLHTYRVTWPIPSPAPLVSILIPTRDHLAITRTAVDSILAKTSYTNYEILILDNQSHELETLAWFEHIASIEARAKVLHYDHPFNYSAINNFGARHARGDVLVLVNNDVEVISPDWLTEMVGHVMRPEIGCVGAKLYYSDGRLQHGGVILGIGGVAGHSHKNAPNDAYGYFSRLKVTQNLSAVTAACLAVRRAVYEQVNGFDEDHLRIAFNDVDFCLKVRSAGYRNVWTPYAELYHHESISRGKEDSPAKVARFNGEVDCMKHRWGSSLALDPYYNPNLSMVSEDFSLA